MKKRPFVTLEKLKEIEEQFPTPFHLYDEKHGMRHGLFIHDRAYDGKGSWLQGRRYHVFFQ